MKALKLRSLLERQCCTRSVACSNRNIVCDSSYNSFCTTNESTKVDGRIEMTESPDLPIWVKISENNALVNKIPDDDFMLPSISYWVENYKHNQPKEDDKTTANHVDLSDVKKITKVLVKPFESPDAVVQALNDCNLAPSETLVAKMLKRFDNNWKSGYGLFIWAESQMGSEFMPETYDLLVDCLGKSKNFDLMWETVEKMEQLGESYVTINTMAKIIRRLTKAGKYEDAVDAFRRIEQFRVKKDLSALNILVDALAKEGNVERAYEIYTEFKNEIPPNSHTFNALIHGWSKARKLERAQSTMEEMKENGISPDVVSYTSFIEAYCLEKDFRKVDKILEEMQEKGCPPNVVTYTIVMHALGKSKQVDKALSIYEKMKVNGCVPDASFYSSLIYILAKAGRLKDARQVFDDIPRLGTQRDTQTYNTMITAACKNNEEEHALKLLQEMEKSGVKPDFDSYAPLLKMCCKLKQMKVLSFLLAHMVENDVSIGLGTYSLLVRGLCKNGKLKHAFMFLEDAVLKGFRPHDSMYKLLETELDKEGMSEEKKRMQQLIESQPKFAEA